jgi:hypothetical protein
LKSAKAHRIIADWNDRLDGFAIQAGEPLPRHVPAESHALEYPSTSRFSASAQFQTSARPVKRAIEAFCSGDGARQSERALLKGRKPAIGEVAAD